MTIPASSLTPPSSATSSSPFLNSVEEGLDGVRVRGVEARVHHLLRGGHRGHRVQRELRVAEKETTLASVLVPMLPVPDTWVEFADHYLDALDKVAADDVVRPRDSWRPADRQRSQRTGELAEWHGALLDRLVDYDAVGRIDRLLDHPALGGPELTFLRARFAHRRGDVNSARDLVYTSLEKLPGHAGFLEFAAEVGADLPPRAQQVADERSRWARPRGAHGG